MNSPKPNKPTSITSWLVTVQQSGGALKDCWKAIKTQDIRKSVQVKFHLNSRQANDAVFEARAIISSQHELVKYHYTNALAKVKFTQQQIAKAKSPKKTANLQKRFEKEQRKLSYWQNHLEAGTFPAVVFGGKKKTSKVNGRNYRQMVLDYLKTGRAYQVEIIRKDSRYYIHVTIEEETPVPYHAHGAVGVDTNPDGLGVALADYLGQYRDSQWLGQGEWTYARSTRRNNLIGEMAKKVVALAKETGNTLVIEDLKFKNDKSVTAKFNRMSHSFVWSKFLAYAERRSLREGVPVIKVKPAFTSIIGILKYQHQYGLSTHQAAACAIARRGLGFDYERVPQLLVDRFIKAKEGFSKLNNWQQWSAVKKAILKHLQKKGVNSLVSWQVHRKELLGVG